MSCTTDLADELEFLQQRELSRLDYWEAELEGCLNANAEVLTIQMVSSQPRIESEE